MNYRTTVRFMLVLVVSCGSWLGTAGDFILYLDNNAIIKEMQ